MALEAKMLINGQLVDGPLTLDVINPATGKMFTTVPRADLAQAEQAIAAAKSAFPAWSAKTLAERRATLEKFADAVRDNAQALTETLVKEQGKPLGEAALEPAYAEAFIRHFATIEFPVEVVQDDATHRIEMHRKPLGVVAGITPWNFPLLMACYKISVFMNVFNVHSNRSPVDGTILEQQYFPGRFVNAAFDKASTENERNALVVELPTGQIVTFIQIAGLVARRILCYTVPFEKIYRGQRYGFIRFGSRVDLYLPTGSMPTVTIGQKVSATSTVLATLPKTLT